MIAEEATAEAVFGAFDGVVSVVGMIFALLAVGTAPRLIALAGLGAAVSATVSMTTGEYESGRPDTPRRFRARTAGAMGAGTAVGSLMPVWPFFVTSGSAALFLGAAGCAAVAAWIGRCRGRGWRGYVHAYAVLGAASALTVAVVSAFPGSGT